MFRDFLEQYIQDLIECSSDNYNITEGQIKEAAMEIDWDEHLWSMIDSRIYEEIDKYRIEEDEK